MKQRQFCAQGDYLHILAAAIITISILLNACGAAPAELPDPIPPQVIRVGLPLALHPWKNLLSQCVSAKPLIGLLVNEENTPGFENNDLILTLGDASLKSPVVVLAGYEELQLIVNPANPVSQLSMADLEKLFDGEAAFWQAVPTYSKSVYTASVIAWVYPLDDDLGRLVVQFFPILRKDSRVAADPGEVIQIVSTSAGGIGIVPQSWLDASTAPIKIIRFPPEQKTQTRIPVFAQTQIEPQGALRDLMACVSQLTPSK